MNRRPASRTRTARVLVVLLAGLLLLAGCGGSQSSEPPAKRLAKARTKLEHTAGVSITLGTQHLPQGVNGIMSATGTGTKAPAFTGTISVIVAGTLAKVPVVAVGGKVYIQLGAWKAIDPGQFGAPDPARLFAADGLSRLLSDVHGLKAGGDIRQGSSILSTLTGTIPGSDAAGLLPTATTSSSFKAQFVLDDSDTLTRAVITGPFYAKAADVTYTIDFSGYGAHPRITAPKLG